MAGSHNQAQHMSNLPAPRPRRTLPDIAPVSWEHPADRAALQALRALPGVDEVIRKVLSLLGGERGIRLLFQANAVRVGPTQFPRLWQMHIENCTTFGWEKIPEVYVTQTPIFNAGAYGVDDPFIVLHSAALEILDEDEILTLLAHELGHVMSGHALYRTIAAILALVSLGALPMLAGIALLPIKLAFLEWSRKAELSADRAGLLGCQDVMVAQRLDLKMAGGGRGEFFTDADLNLDAFMAQANEYVNTNEGLDIVYKVLHTLGVTHPMHTVRAAEIQKWVAAGDYERILAGEYVRRGSPEDQRPLGDHWKDAKDYYSDAAKDFGQQVGDAVRSTASKAADAFRSAQKRGSSA
ncbi:MAG: M48 family peptidase [Gemmatimonadales bacterium]|jgi:Zn-dependent protease with chaperone function|nr:MAG: M48 family peptidase [Gemmatimonadales bacterium]